MSARAVADLFQVLTQSFRDFGPSQASRYEQGLRRTLLTLAANPRMGRPARTATDGLRRHEHRSHVIFYRPEPDGILVVAILHGRSIQSVQDNR